MKLFQRLLVAPAALGLIAPLGANAAEPNIQDLSDYSSSRASRAAKQRVQGFSQFSDVYPTDWAYKTLNSMLQNHDCAPISTGGAMTRYEAASLLNKCLGNVSQVNEEERRLIDEFSQELAVIKGRSDVLEAGISLSEVGGFSATTKMNGEAVFVVGGSTQGDSGTKESTTFNYKLAYGIETSFSGQDLMFTELESGNFTDTDPFGCSGDVALEACASSSSLELSRLYYQRPIADDFTLTVGASIRQDDMLGVWPSAYPSDTVLDTLTYAGATAAYNLSSGAGAGLTYAKDKISASLLFVSEEASDATNTAGLLTSSGSDDVTAQLAWVDEGFTVAAAFTSSDGGNEANALTSDDFNAVGISGYYELDTGIAYLPSSISAGMGWKNPDKVSKENHIVDETTWTVGLLWDDVWLEGSTLGIAYGTAAATRSNQGSAPKAAELFYSWPVSDSITVTPALFFVEKEGADDYEGALVKTTFSF